MGTSLRALRIAGKAIRGLAVGAAFASAYWRADLSGRAADASASPSIAGEVELFADDFSRFLPGPLTAPLGKLNAAIQEYHYLANRGVDLGPWANAICHIDAWVA